MEIKGADLVSLLEESLRKLDKGPREENLEEIGHVVQVGDASCTIYGLTHAVYGELVQFEGGAQGIILDLQEYLCTVFLLDVHTSVAEHEVVRRTGSEFKIPVGSDLIGRVVNAIGTPIDGAGELTTKELLPIEVSVPGIIERSPVNEPLETGLMVVDALVPIGKGQRELIIGNRSTGKTAIALDTILNQKGKNVICVYVAVGQRQANVARIVHLLEEQGALDYTVVVSADASSSALNQYLAPYAGTTIGEYFRAQKRDVLVVYDDLSNHAVAYREISLLMRRPPGREAYPGDVFYLHSRLLERAGKLLSGGSLTALPIVQIQGDDITAYIPTNLISITDGQIFLDTKLFNAGVRPAVNVELSVSRVGGAAQTKAVKQMTRALRLEIAQYNELLAFSQFGSELDLISQRKLARGAIVVELFKQPQFSTYSSVTEVLQLFLLRENFLDQIPQGDVRKVALQFASFVQSVYPDLYKTIEVKAAIEPETQGALQTIAIEFMRSFAPDKEVDSD